MVFMLSFGTDDDFDAFHALAYSKSSAEVRVMVTDGPRTSTPIPVSPVVFLSRNVFKNMSGVSKSE